MSQLLPTGGFKWIIKDSDSWDRQKIYDLVKQGRKGYVLEVDVDYPPDTHDLHKDLPFMPQVIDGKLTPNLNDKTQYVIHIRTLDQGLSHGLILCRVH